MLSSGTASAMVLSLCKENSERKVIYSLTKLYSTTSISSTYRQGLAEACRKTCGSAQKGKVNRKFCSSASVLLEDENEENYEDYCV